MFFSIKGHEIRNEQVPELNQPTDHLILFGEAVYIFTRKNLIFVGFIYSITLVAVQEITHHEHTPNLSKF